MVMKKSEYQKQFRSSVARNHQEIYLENLAFRHNRRDKEFVHTPIYWGGEEETTSSDSGDEPVQQTSVKIQEPGPQYKSLAEILTCSRQQDEAYRLKRRSEITDSLPDVSKLTLTDSENFNNSASAALPVKNNTCDNNIVSEDKDIGDKSYSLYDMLVDENKRLNEKIAKISCGQQTSDCVPTKEVDDGEIIKKSAAEVGGASNLRKNAASKRQAEKASKDMRSKSGCKEQKRKGKPVRSGKYKGTSQAVPSLHLSSTGRLRRPDRQGGIPKARPRPQTAESLESRPPFVAYGAADVEANLADHRTHNVLALSDVYPLALKAKTRREEERRQMSKQRQRVKSAQSELLSKLTASPREEDDWSSEYSKQFHAYQPRDYERASSARAVVPRVTPLRAVHRGGCLVLHVD